MHQGKIIGKRVPCFVRYMHGLWLEDLTKVSTNMCNVHLVFGAGEGGDGESRSVFANMVAQTGRETSEKLREAALKAEADKAKREEGGA